MAKNTTSLQQFTKQRRELFNEMKTNGNKATLNRIYSSIGGSQRTIEQVVSDDAISPGNSMMNRQQQTVYNTKTAGVNDCIGAASEQEIADILDRIVDEMIIYSDSNRFCEPDYSLIDGLDINDNIKEALKEQLSESFNRVYRLFKYSRHNIRAKKDVTGVAKEWLTIGKIAYFIVYDNVMQPTKIVDIIQIDLRKYTLVKHEEYINRNKGQQFDISTAELVTYWSIHENTGVDKFGKMTYSMQSSAFNYTIDSMQYQKNIFSDGEIAIADWSQVEFELSNFFSYVSMLLRPFNILRIMERTKIIWAVMNSRFRTMYIIPVKGKGRIRGKQTISEVMNEYKDHVEFNNTSGEIRVNGQPDLPFNKEIWMGETTSGVPQIKNLNDTNGPDMSDITQLRPFEQKLQKASKLPMSRFEDNNAIYWDNNPMQISIDERRFAKYIEKVQQQFIEPLRKAMYQQLLVAYPQYIGDTNIYDAIGISCNINNKYETLMQLEVMTKTIQTIGQASDELKTYDEEGYEVPLISKKFLFEKYIDMTESDKIQNEKYIKQEQENIKKAMQNKTLADPESLLS